MGENRTFDYTDYPDFKEKLASLFSYLKRVLNMDSAPKLKLVRDIENAQNILGKSGYYDVQNDLIVVYVTNRHPKDILRTFTHEMRHRFQYENNLFNIENEPTDPGYAQSNPNLRNAESDAYAAMLLLRDWEDNIKKNGK